MKFTEEQLRDADLATRQKYMRWLKTEQEAHDETFAHENQIYAGYKSFSDSLKAPAEGLRWLIGKDIDAAKMIAPAQLHLSMPDQAEFRYQSLPMFQGLATFRHEVWEAIKANPMIIGGPAFILADAVSRTASESQKGFPWATGAGLDRGGPGFKERMDQVEDLVTSVMDPFWLADYAANAIKAIGEESELRELLPIAQKMIDATKSNTPGADMIIAALPTWGADSGTPSFVSAIKDIEKSGGTPEDVAKWIYIKGIRSSKWAEVNSMPLSDWFKRGYNLFPPRLRETAQDFLWNKQAILKEQQAAKEAIKSIGITQAELPQVQETLRAVNKDPWDPVGSFNANYLQGLRDGTVKYVEPETLKKIQSLVEQIHSGWREDSAWMPNYSPSKVNDILLSGAAEGKASRGYRLKQENYTPFDNLKDYTDAIAKVKSRVFKADTVDAFAEQVKQRTDLITEAIKKILPDGIPGLRSENATQFDESGKLPLNKFPHLVTRAQLEQMPQEARQLLHERNVLDSMTKALKELADSKDPLAELAQKDPTGTVTKILNLYDGALGIFKSLKLNYNPYFAWHRLIDMASRAFVETGEVMNLNSLYKSMKGQAAGATDAFGNIHDFGESPIELLYGKGQSEGAFDKIITGIDKAVHNHIGQAQYDLHYGDNLKAGLEPQQAHHYALRSTRETLDRVHGMYENSSSGMKVLQRFYPFVNHFVQATSYWTGLAAKYPTEAYALLRARELQQKFHPDLAGAFPITKNLSFDPFKSLTLTRTLEPILHTDKIMDAPEAFRHKIQRGLQVITGQAFPHIDLALQALGVAKQHNPMPLSDFEHAIGFLTRNSPTGEELASDPLYHLFGKNPGEDRDSYLERQALTYSIAAQRSGHPIAPDEALLEAQHAQTINTLGSRLGIVYGDPEVINIHSALADFKQTLLETPPEYRAGVRPALLTEPKFQGLEKVLPFDPVVRYNAATKATNLEKVQVYSLLPPNSTDPEFRSMAPQPRPEMTQQMTKPNMDAKDVIETFSRTPLGRIISNVYGMLVSPAGAEMTPDRAEKIKAMTPAVAINSAGQSTFQSDGTPDGRQSAIYRHVDFGTHLNILNGLRTPEQLAGYIDKQVATPEGKNLLNSIRNLGNAGDMKAQGIASYYDLVKSGFSTPIKGDTPFGIYHTQGILKDLIHGTAQHSGPDVGIYLRGSPEQIHQKLADKSLPIGIGLDINAWSPGNIQMVQQELRGSNLETVAKMNYENRIDSKYPGVNDFINHNLVNEFQIHSGNADTAHQYMDEINGKIKSGALPQDFWSAVKNFHSEIYDNVAIHYQAPSINAITHYAFAPFFDPKTQRPYDINIEHVGEINKNGYGALLGAAMLHSPDPIVKDLLARLGPELEAKRLVGEYSGPPASAILQTDAYSQKIISSSMDYATGLARHPFELIPVTNPDGSIQMVPGEKEMNSTGTGGINLTSGPAGVNATTQMRVDSQNLESKIAPRSEASPVTLGAQSTIPPRTEANQTTERPQESFQGSRADTTLAVSTPPIGTSLPSEGFASPAAQAAFNIRANYSLGQSMASSGIDPKNFSDANLSYATAPTERGYGVSGNESQMIAAGQQQAGEVGGAAGAVGAAGEAAGSLSTFGRLGEQSGLFSSKSDAGKATTVLGMTGAGAGAGFALGGPVGAGIGAGIGLAAGLGATVFGSNSNRDQEFEDLRAAEIQQQKTRYAAATLPIRERAIASQGSNGMSPSYAKQFAPQLQAFQRRPTFASRVGIVDTLERQLGSQLQAHW